MLVHSCSRSADEVQSAASTLHNATSEPIVMAIEDLVHPWLKHYTAGPQWAKTLVGGLYAWIPERLRYGPSVSVFTAEAELRDPAALRELAQHKLATTLRWALATVPAYAELGIGQDQASSPYTLLARLPLLDKQALKAGLERYCSTRLSPRQRLATHTGGSTSIPMRLYLERFVTRSKDFAFNRCFDAMVGIGPREPVFVLRGRVVPGAGAFGDRVWAYDPIRRFVHLSSDHLEPRFMPMYMAAMRRWKARFIQAFPSAIMPLAHWLLEHPEPDITDRIAAIQLYSENTYAHQIELLKKVFQCPVYLEYGHSERAAKAISLADDLRYFFWPAYGHTELIGADGAPVSEPGALGEIVVTSFDNRAMPLVRYRTGDYATLGASNPLFPGFLAAERIEGRLQEFLVCADHRVVSICSIGAAHFDALAGAQRMQFEQTQPGHAVLKVVADATLTPASVRALQQGVRGKTQGGVEITVQRVSEVQRTRAGKHLLLVQHLDVAEYLGAAGNITPPALPGSGEDAGS